MRFALVATPLLRPGTRPPPGALDGDMLRARLPHGDTSFAVLDLDPTVDLAEQIDRLFDERAPGPGDSVMLYASTFVVVAADGEFFLCLDPDHPEVGDGLADLAEVFAERCRGPVLFVLECRHAPDRDDPFRAASVVEAARSAVDGEKTGIELLVAASVAAKGDGAVASPFSRALVEAFDEADPSSPTSLEAVYGRLRGSDRILGRVPAFAHVRGRDAFEMITARTRSRRRHSEAPPSAPTRAAEEAPAVSGVIAAVEAPAAPIAIAPVVVDAPAAAPIAIAPVVVDAPAAAPIVIAAVAPPLAIPPAPVPMLIPAVPVPVVRAPAPAAAAPPSSPPRGASVSMSFDAPVSSAPAALPRVMIDAPPPEPPASPPSAPLEPPAVALAPAPSRAAPAAAEAPPAAPSPPASVAAAEAPAKPVAARPLPLTVPELIAEADALGRDGKNEEALGELKKALGLLGKPQSSERADVYVRVGVIKQRQEKLREAISNFEKALALEPSHPVALEALLACNVALGEWRAVQLAEDRVLAIITDEDELFTRLCAFGSRWLGDAGDRARARAVLGRACAIRDDDVGVLQMQRAIAEAEGDVEHVIALRRRIAGLAKDPVDRARQTFALAKDCLAMPDREDLGIALLDAALDGDPTVLEPLELLANILAERQEWGELEQAYRKMLARSPRIPAAQVRSKVRWELGRMLGLLFRDHLVDPASALDAFEEALRERPDDLGGHLTAASLAQEIGDAGRAETHLHAAAVLDPTRVETLHALFEAYVPRGQVDRAFLVATVTSYLGAASDREAAVVKEYGPKGLPQPQTPLDDDGWTLLEASQDVEHIGAILEAITDAAIAVRVAELGASGRLPVLDPAALQDPEKSTVSIVRSLKWASHYLDMPAPAVYVSDDPALGLAAVPAAVPTALAGGAALRGRSLADLAFLAGRHLAYYLGAHRLLLHFPSLDDLSTCFICAVKIVMPEVPVPARFVDAASVLRPALARALSAEDAAELREAVHAFEKHGARADLGGWAAAVERCSTRAGYLLAGDLGVAAQMLKADGRGVLTADEKIEDLLRFTLSAECHEVRALLGVALPDKA